LALGQCMLSVNEIKMNDDRKEPAPRNRTLNLSVDERERLRQTLMYPPIPESPELLIDRIICADAHSTIDSLPRYFVDLLILDPPYNLKKQFGATSFREMSLSDYERWFENWFVKLLPTLKKTASLYVCGDWKSSAAVHQVLTKHTTVRNRITWEREKGRGAQKNWKNASEDIWFATVSDDYVFNIDAVKLKRRVIAPYRVDGRPKDWQETENGGLRLTHPSNLWTDITVPFWSMPENTDHPTQKPEKLIAKLILASTNKGDFVLDPFLGSGTTATVARKLNRRFLGIELDRDYACLAAKRVEVATSDRSIQGYSGGVFWERNSLNLQTKLSKVDSGLQTVLFEESGSYESTTVVS
jgi:site-specific DNA-methyltransferase (adenine-specific)